MKCDCDQLEDIVNCGDDELQEFIQPKALRFLREKPGRRLYSCPLCDTYWQVDHMERGPQAIKVAEPSNWERFDDRPYRLNFMERFHGGCGPDRCIWQGCSKFALKGMALCITHAYPEFSIESPRQVGQG